MNGVPVKALTRPLSDQFLTIAWSGPEPFRPKGRSATKPSWKMGVRPSPAGPEFLSRTEGWFQRTSDQPSSSVRFMAFDHV